jgi:hypothetical protein
MSNYAAHAKAAFLQYNLFPPKSKWKHTAGLVETLPAIRSTTVAGQLHNFSIRPNNTVQAIAIVIG